MLRPMNSTIRPQRAGSTRAARVVASFATLVTLLALAAPLTGLAANDFGDAPDSYSTLLGNSGAYHILGGPHLGPTAPDAEADGQPTPGADGDDLAGVDDEDGVALAGPLVARTATSIWVQVSAPGLLSAWIDFDQNGLWSHPDEAIANDLAVTAGLNEVTFQVPAVAPSGVTMARFRISTAGGLTPQGGAADGEVEDHPVALVGLDFGDAPAGYPVTAVSNGACHRVPSALWMGTAPDAEIDGVNSDDANNDNQYGQADEDGAFLTGALTAGGAANLIVIASTSGLVNAWIDFDNNQSWDESADRIADNLPVVAGTNALPFTIPPGVAAALHPMRVRISSSPLTSYTGEAEDGEVEDSLAPIGLTDFDYGDAPSDFPVTLAADGARHHQPSAIWMGATIDGEMDGQPSPTANGDDAAGIDDEDGVTVGGSIEAGGIANFTINVSADCYANAWIDFNGNMSWADSGEQVVANVAVTTGVNILSFSIPPETTNGVHFARVRVSSSQLSGFTGEASDGEVEDLGVGVGVTRYDFGDAPPPYPVTAAQDGARHGQPTTIWMGAQVDVDADGQPSAGADGDDLANLDDEDGASFPLPLVVGATSTLRVVSSAAGLVSAWVDFDGNGDWSAPADWIVNNGGVVAGTNLLSFTVPPGAVPGTTAARVRISTGSIWAPTGAQTDGEVEDLLVGIAASLEDFGDAPTNFPVLASQNGARHIVPSALYLGTAPDGEADGQPGAGATGDDSAGVDDEDGASFSSTLIRGAPVDLVITSSAPGLVSAWIDFNRNLSWADAGEQIATNVGVVAGPSAIPFVVPESASPGTAYVRVRIASAAIAGFTGAAADGEVEDFAATISGLSYDYGDAPASFPVMLAQDGARHTVVAGVRLGALLDSEGDGQASPDATGDDSANQDDEDGVVLPVPYLSGATVTAQVTASVSGYLGAWLDVNGDGDWADAGEQVWSGVAVTTGLNRVAINAAALSVGLPHAFRVRFATAAAGVTNFTGAAADGEVEDYLISVEDTDWGDAPAGYPTTDAEEGARHAGGSGLRLGTAWDAEATGVHSAGADADDLAGAPDDEDGVVLIGDLVAGSTVTVRVVASAPGLLNAWIDMNANASWDEAADHVFTDTALVAGTNDLTLAIPPDMAGGLHAARFRLSTAGGLSPSGLAPDGEVEDYVFSGQSFDFGDAPATFPVLLADDGARHLGPSAIRLGAQWDTETDGAPSAQADGDDLAGAPDDEDGVSAPGGLFSGRTNTLRVVASAAAVLNAWLDLDGNGDWTNAAEHVLVDVAVAAGTNDVALTIPLDAHTGLLAARFRLSSASGLAATGLAADGEVEDHLLAVQGRDFGDAPASFPVTLAQDGARHLGPSALHLGSLWDAEADAAASALASSDDTGGIDDEDGVSAPGGLLAGRTNAVQVTASAAGLLNAWVDLNEDGTWSGAGEHVASDLAVAAGSNSFALVVPGTVTGHVLFARFRLASAAGLQPTGEAADGEVEDHALALQSLDLGDAPATFPVTLAQDGARHLGPSSVRLGAEWDAEADGQPNASATGDDVAGVPDDEDGVTLPDGLVRGATNIVHVAAPAGGRLDAWLDFDRSGTWEAAEQVFTNVALSAGDNDLPLPLPAALATGPLFARFRVSTAGGLAATGLAADGEVEDHELTVQGRDLGDAPALYPVTLAQDGARHRGPSALFLGTAWDAEADGQPGASANGDDLAGSDDEDGVTTPFGVAPGVTNAVVVHASAAGYLNAWFDLNGDGDWADAGEQMVSNLVLSAGDTTLGIVLPGVVPSTLFARYRIASAADLSFTGEAADGEVEDYAYPIALADFGDAPATYPVTVAQGGARHVGPSGLYLGTAWDGEADGAPSAAADGDDLAGTDDEDGVTLPQGLAAGVSNLVRVVASAPGVLSAWFDLDRDGTWAQAGDHVLANVPVAAGTNDLHIDLPPGLAAGALVARFRLSTTIGLSADGAAPDGEVEDYVFTLLGQDFGDAPASFPVTAAQDGARHAGPSALYLGAAWDAESDGLASAGADGDDTSGADDEDGVSLPYGLVVGRASNGVRIVASAAGLVNAWMDLNRNGSWSDAGEQVLSNAVVAAGDNDFNLSLPGLTSAGFLAARFRLSTAPASTPVGPAADGEVEDYLLPAEGADFGDAPASYPVTSFANGARHRGPSALYLGAVWDGEADGLPSAGADGDDLSGGPDDEDGISLPVPLRAGTGTNVVRVAASAPGLVNAWMDLNRDGAWNNEDERVLTNTAVSAGVNELLLSLPEAVTAGTVVTRFRLSSAPLDSYEGEAADGEVEDLLVGITEAYTRDFGDAPSPYPTRLADGGASHIASTSLRLGSYVDVEVDGQPAADALGDDANGAPDDEDGVLLPATWLLGDSKNIPVIASTNGLLNAWIDLNRDGDWDDAGERVATDLAVTAGTNVLSLSLPPGTVVGPTYLRFRLSTVAGLAPGGVAPDGEVEDHRLVITQSVGEIDPPEMTGIARAGTSTVLQVNAAGNIFYELQASTNLPAHEGGWSAKGVPLRGPVASFTNSNGTKPVESFRVVVPYIE